MNLSRPLLLGCLVLVACTGCWMDYYQDREQKTVDKLKKEELFYKYLQLAPYKHEDVGVNIRLPAVLQTPTIFTLADEASPEKGYKVQAPDFHLPGFVYTFESPHLIQATKWPLTASFHLLELKGGIKADMIQKGIQAIFKTKPDVKVTGWESINVPTPDGGTKTYQYLSAVGPMKFDPVDQSGAFKDYDGRYDLYMATLDSHVLIIAWRAPDIAAKETNFFDAAKASMGTLTFTAPTPAAAPMNPMNPMNPAPPGPMPPGPAPIPMNPAGAGGIGPREPVVAMHQIPADQISPPMKDLLAALTGKPMSNEPAFRRHAAPDVANPDSFHIYDFEQPYVLKKEARDGLESYTIQVKGGIVIRVFQMDWQGDKIKSVKQLKIFPA